MSADDADLLKRASAGDHDAFAVIVDRYGVPVRDYLFRLVRSRDGAEDLKQETFIRLYRNAGRYARREEPEMSLNRLLFKIARRVAIDSIRSERARTRALERLVWQPRQESQRPDDAAIAAQSRRRLLAAVARLPHHLRRTLVLHDAGEHTCDEVAVLDQCTVAVVKSRLRRARLALRRLTPSRHEEGN
jgi:RNA polymerase sigma-70 factor (ECF subfamily)